MPWRSQWRPTPVFLPGEPQGRGSLAGFRLWGRTESDTTEATQQQQRSPCRPLAPAASQASSCFWESTCAISPACKRRAPLFTWKTSARLSHFTLNFRSWTSDPTEEVGSFVTYALNTLSTFWVSSYIYSFFFFALFLSLEHKLHEGRHYTYIFSFFFSEAISTRFGIWQSINVSWKNNKPVTRSFM